MPLDNYRKGKLQEVHAISESKLRCHPQIRDLEKLGSILIDFICNTKCIFQPIPGCGDRVVMTGVHQRPPTCVLDSLTGMIAQILLFWIWTCNRPE
jgi:hypothetical protein